MSDRKGVRELSTADKYYFAGDFENALAHSKAITQVGLMYYNGIGTEVDYEKAAGWLDRSPLFFLRDAPAVYTLAEMYFYGRGVEQNYSRAFGLYSFAFSCGCNVNAAFRIAEITAKKKFLIGVAIFYRDIALKFCYTSHCGFTNDL